MRRPLSSGSAIFKTKDCKIVLGLCAPHLPCLFSLQQTLNCRHASTPVCPFLLQAEGSCPSHHASHLMSSFARQFVWFKLGGAPPHLPGFFAPSPLLQLCQPCALRCPAPFSRHLCRNSRTLEQRLRSRGQAAFLLKQVRHLHLIGE